MFCFDISSKCHHATQERKPSAPVAAIEEGFRTVRESIQSVTGSISDQKGQLSGYYEHAKDQTKCEYVE